MKRISLPTIAILLVYLAIALTITAYALLTQPVAASFHSLASGSPSAPPRISGTVTHDVAYLERAFPLGRRTLDTSQALTVQLWDLSAAETEPVVLGQEVIYVAGGPPPYQFAIRYDALAIRPEGKYALTAEIAVDGSVMFTASTGLFELQPEAVAPIVLVLEANDLQLSAGLPSGIERLSRFSY